MRTIAFLTLDIPLLPKANFPVSVELKDNGTIELLEPRVLRFLDPLEGVRLIDDKNRVRLFSIEKIDGRLLKVKEIKEFPNRRKSIRLPFIGRYRGYCLFCYDSKPDIMKLRDISFEAVAAQPIGDCPMKEGDILAVRFYFPFASMKTKVLNVKVLRKDNLGVVLKFEKKDSAIKELILNLTFELKHLLKKMEVV